MPKHAIIESVEELFGVTKRKNKPTRRWKVHTIEEESVVRFTSNKSEIVSEKNGSGYKDDDMNTFLGDV